MTVTIDPKAGSVLIAGIVVDLAPRTDAAGKEVPRDPGAVAREILAQGMKVLGDAYTATQLDAAALTKMVADKQAEANRLAAARPTILAEAVATQEVK